MNLLIASNGMETRVLLDGVQLPTSESILFEAIGGESPTLDINGIPIAYKDGPENEEAFFKNVERMLGYKITSK